ncbi:phosphoserine phosphatase [Kluyveromyces lactis]|uniref:phosphoserine phosphatase n=1 Tax=Kluyveromyces lactis (strain ATCC 8585 / CBS 2359 / DSM 70799 / NBRC 1267 / NRRL Y-1140 / WM37) TaxID=284590 RepID=Q6CN02_KLULA|nr:uncharacterized protein KLLA0_E16369g [Kluyveromyces lactis]CAG99774.1 KLLA0E16369p [Kluyveromyces lactis]|eukprot:XP_454687.1 uncharacterized protein KLLA0_E16369g [Kluyveromyces lactis]
MSVVDCVVTCIAHRADCENISVTKVEQELIQQLKASSKEVELNSEKGTQGIRWLCKGKSVDIYVKVADGGLDELKRAVSTVEPLFSGVDLIVQLDNEFRKNKQLFVFDMDSTLIYQEVIEMIAAYADVEPQVKLITDRAMNNEIDFCQSLRERVKLLKGIQTRHLYDEIKPRLRVTKGVPELSRALKSQGCKLAVLSGGFIPFANYIKEKLNFDFALANTLGVEVSDDGTEQLNGEALGDIVDGVRKAKTLVALAEQYNSPIESTVMVGDGGNDLNAMAAAGFGIAWNAKPKVQEQAPCKLNSDTMIDVLYILGHTEKEIETMIKE